MEALGNVQYALMWVLGVAAIGLQAAALLDAVRARADAFPASGQQTKVFWLVLLGVAVAIGLVSVQTPLNIFNLAAVIAAGVYLTRVRPAVRQISGGGSTGSSGSW